MNCIGCGQTYFVLSGHSCGDNGNATEVRALLAKEIDYRQSLEAKLEEIKHNLMPIAMHFSGQYNKWRHGSPEGRKAVGYEDAGKFIIQLVKS